MLSAYIYMHVSVMSEDAKGIGSPRAGVTDNSELPGMEAGNWTQLL